MKTKRFLMLLLAAFLLINAAACTTESKTDSQAPDTTDSFYRSFTDSSGRVVQVPAQIDKLAITGPMAQTFVFALCPDRLVGICNAWSEEAEAYLEEKYYHMPQIGQLYGGKGELNLETLLQSGAQIVIDVGEPKDSVKEDMDALQEQTGIPFVHISAQMTSYPAAYRMLGELLNMQEEAERLAQYCEKIYARTQTIASAVEKAKVLYITGDSGQNVIARGSYHAQILDLLTDNLAVVDEPSSKGTGNEVSMEQILLWNPDVVIFSPDSIYDTVAQDATWHSVTAIQNGKYYEVPFGPYNWMGFPPSVQRYLGMLWLCKLLYPQAAAPYDLYEDVHGYYELFYHCDLSRDQFDALVANSIGK